MTPFVLPRETRHFKNCRKKNLRYKLVLLLLMTFQVQGIGGTGARGKKSSEFAPLSVARAPSQSKHIKHTRARRTKSAKSEKGKKHPPALTEPPLPSEAFGTSSLVDVTGVTMMLGGVEPLDASSRRMWERVTGGYLAELLLVTHASFTLTSQDPPFQRGRSLALQSDSPIQTLVFDMSLSTQPENDVNQILLDAFVAKKATYIDVLAATNDPAFANVTSLTLNLPTTLNIPTTEKRSGESSEKRPFGNVFIIIAMAILGTIMIVIAAYGLRRSMRSKEPTGDMSSKQQPSVNTGSLSVDAVASDDVDEVSQAGDGSVYWQGSISVALSADTDCVHGASPRPCALPPRKDSESTFDESTLFPQHERVKKTKRMYEV